MSVCIAICLNYVSVTRLVADVMAKSICYARRCGLMKMMKMSACKANCLLYLSVTGMVADMIEKVLCFPHRLWIV